MRVGYEASGGRGERGWWGNMKERAHLEDLGIEGR